MEGCAASVGRATIPNAIGSGRRELETVAASAGAWPMWQTVQVASSCGVRWMWKMPEPRTVATSVSATAQMNAREDASLKRALCPGEKIERLSSVSTIYRPGYTKASGRLTQH